MDKYYFVSVNSRLMRLPSRRDFVVIKKHPFEWIKTWGDMFSIIDYREITKEEYYMSDHRY